MSKNQNFDYNSLDSESELEKVSPQTTKKIKKLFFILVSTGLVIGIISAFAVVKILNHFNLTETTPQFKHQLQK